MPKRKIRVRVKRRNPVEWPMPSKVMARMKKDHQKKWKMI